MATRITPAERLTTVGQHAGMERSIAISRPTVGADGLYTSIVSTAPGDKTRIHHHGDCETSIYILTGSARYTWGPTGLEHEMTAASGDVIYIPAGEVHVEENASMSEPLVVVLTRNCADSHVVYVDGGPDGSDDIPGALLSAMATGWHDRTLLDLLTEHGLELSPEHAFPTDGWSGATFTGLVDPVGRRFVLKRTSLATDWIARATRDGDLREGWLAARPTGDMDWLPRTSIAYLGAAADGDGVAILMPDLSTELIAWERPGYDPVIDDPTLRRVIELVARLHAMPWSRVLESSAEKGGEPAPPWCPLPERLTLLARPSAAAYAAAGNAVGERFLAGWDAFERRAPAPARELVERLGADPAPLVAALSRLPDVGLHGDLKLANVALLPEDRVGFIDWQMTLRAPLAVDLGWFLVSNSSSLPAAPESIVAEYRQALEWDSGRWGFGGDAHDFAGLAGDWDTQLDLTWIVGLLLRGWRKGLDAERGVRLASRVSAADDLAWWCERAVEAAERRL